MHGADKRAADWPDPASSDHVKIYGRTSPSHTYQITSVPSSPAERDPGLSRGIPIWLSRAIAVPGWLTATKDSSAAMCWPGASRKHVAYICPMDVLLLDVAQTLEATEVRLPGGEPVVILGDSNERANSARDAGAGEDEDLDDLFVEEEEDDEPPPLMETAARVKGSPANSASSIHSLSTSNQGSSSPMRLDTSSELRGLAGRLEDMNSWQDPEDWHQLRAWAWWKSIVHVTREGDGSGDS